MEENMNKEELTEFLKNNLHIKINATSKYNKVKLQVDLFLDKELVSSDNSWFWGAEPDLR
jgi:hypothetical protein